MFPCPARYIYVGYVSLGAQFFIAAPLIVAGALVIAILSWEWTGLMPRAVSGRRLRPAGGAIDVPAKFNPSSSGVWPAGGGRAPKARGRRGNILGTGSAIRRAFAQKPKLIPRGQ
jgi:hypothetical protein